MDDPKRIYECLLDYCSTTAIIDQVSIGLVWTICRSQLSGRQQSGLAMTPQSPTRTLRWPGTLVNKPVKDIARWVLQWEPYQATVGMAALNSSINACTQTPPGMSLHPHPGAANLTVFEHFLPQLKEKKVVVIGHYPGIEDYIDNYGWQVVERQPAAGDLPDPASEFLLPEADWVFLSASTIPNKTFPRLAQLSQSATTVLMGPTVPWLAELQSFGVDYLAGVEVVNEDALFQTAQEGGGVRIFETGVQYKVIAINDEVTASWLKQQIAETFAGKERLNLVMEQWYSAGNNERFPQYAELQAVNQKLSRLDLAYKKVWDRLE